MDLYANPTHWFPHLPDMLKISIVLNYISNCRTGYVPKCKAISCPSPLPPLNGKVMDNGHYLVGNTVQYSCNEGFVLIGEPIIRCTESGLWSHAPPFCKYLLCIKSGHHKFVDTGITHLISDTLRGWYD